ncbi:BRO family protein [Macrococcus armenti]|uniref:BRO family protein n=1 Tax=Macrococcus armenti TaxID=2875764 RepID=UPI001CCDED0F|nr:BRO family protein [Macrococcus armenti]UBH14887.1 ORF6C domain-containing protein [Macrococcus armenti]UBH17247.1 ORF6C domain-containing protein [Macrococcus armenti]UBH19512.1 ORF6C domain-containing protein [Macrococcus armenti]
MNEIKVISNENILGNDFQIYGTNEEPLFLAKDVANWIEHNNVTLMLSLVEDDEKLTYALHNSGQKRQMWFLTEDGMYEILMQSRKPIAKQFKKQVKHILKELRTKGEYKVPSNPMEALELMFQEQKNTNEEVANIRSEVIDLKENQKLASDEYDHLRRTINKRVMSVIDIQKLYGQTKEENKQIKDLLYKDINNEVNSSCYVTTRTQIRQKYSDRALQTAFNWHPNQSTLNRIKDIQDGSVEVRGVSNGY